MPRLLIATVAALFAAGGAQAQTGTYNGHTYTYVSTALDFASANAAATGLGGYLATVTSQGEQDFLRGLTATTAYIGGSDAASEGTWRWLSGPEAGKSFFSASGAPVDIAYSFWSGGEPNDVNGEDALLINWAGGGQWNDIGSASLYGYIVEFDPVSGGVPEPATWAMMIGGMGLAGGALRRRRRVATLRTA